MPQVETIKYEEMKDFILNLDTPTKINDFTKSQPTVSNPDIFLATIGKKDAEISAMFKPFDVILDTERNKLIWVEMLRRVNNDLREEFNKGVDPMANSLALLASVMGAEARKLIKPPENVDQKLLEMCIRTKAILEYVLSQAALEIQIRIGFDQLYVPDPNGNIYAPHDLRTTLAAVSKNIL